MAALSGVDVVRALDRGVNELGQVRALLEVAGHDPLGLPVGAGDRLLVGLVHALSPDPIELVVACSSCGEKNEVVVTPSDLGPYEPRSRWLGPGRGVRPPTYRDLLDLPDDEERAVDALCARCSVGAVPLAEAVSAIDEIDTSLAGPIALACVECSASLTVESDIEQLALARLRAVADGVDREVHLLASRYSWDLATIDALPDERRRRLARLAGDR